MAKKRKKKEKIKFNTKEMIEIFNNLLENKEFVEKVKPFPVFDEKEANTLIWLLFWKTDEFRVWMIKKCDKKAVREFVQHRESQRRGVPLKMSTIYMRRMKFFNELLKCRFNSAEAARRCGYSWKYAKQAGYRIRRSLY